MSLCDGVNKAPVFKRYIVTIAEIEKMSIIERLQAMEELWDSLCHEESEI